MSASESEPSQVKLRSRFMEGIALFNQREFFECHEVLEEVWKQQNGADKQVTQGIIQIAVAYYHYLRANRNGALKLLQKGLSRLQPYGPEFCGLLLGDFISAVQSDQLAISESKPVEELILPQIPVVLKS
ncbi:MAG: DUF309 domain-containing protein [Candidatus Obscuribacterales bacterium]|nr:DUF309 domain-containing protein [Candidatus Obscuribacterales bacterium]